MLASINTDNLVINWVFYFMRDLTELGIPYFIKSKDRHLPSLSGFYNGTGE